MTRDKFRPATYGVFVDGPTEADEAMTHVWRSMIVPVPEDIPGQFVHIDWKKVELEMLQGLGVPESIANPELVAARTLIAIRLRKVGEPWRRALVVSGGGADETPLLRWPGARLTSTFYLTDLPGMRAGDWQMERIEEEE